jgi:hypothetical protein
MASTVKGSARKGFRNTHGKKGLPKGARSPYSVPGGTAGGGMGKGGENVRGNAGNAQKSGTP